MTELLRVALIYTPLQRLIYRSIEREFQTPSAAIFPAHRTDVPDGSLAYHPIYTSDQKLSIQSARQLLAEVDNTIYKITSGENYELWLASCDTPIGQALINHKNCVRTVLFEDGIGSYVRHDFLDSDKGARNLARKIKYLIYLFPRYRSLYGIGSHAANECWSLHPSAFPRSHVRPKQIDISHLKATISTTEEPIIHATDGVAIYLDQPLSRTTLPSTGITTAIQSHIKKLDASKEVRKYFIKQHPTSTEFDLRNTLNIFRSTTRNPVEVVTQDTPIENLVTSKSFNPIEVFSILSSALYTIKSIRTDLPVTGIMSSEITKISPYVIKYIQSLETMGVKFEVY